MTSTETCSYEFDPDRREQVRGRELRLVDDLPIGWSCDRPAGANGRCLFHRDPADKSDLEVLERLLEEIGRPPDSDAPDAVVENRFIGARFGDCRLAHRVLQPGNNRPIDLRFAHVEGDLIWDRAVVQNPVRLSGIVVDGEATFRNARVNADMDLSDSVIGGGLDASDAVFENHFWCINTTFGGGVTFDRSVIEGDLCLAGAAIHGNLRLASTEIDGNACFSRIDCAGALVVEPRRIDGNVWCVRSSFETFDDPQEPDNLLRGGDMGGDVVIRESAFGDKITLEGIDVDGRFIFEGTAVDSNWVDLTGCSIGSGTLGQPEDESAYTMYDFTDATVGDVRIRDVRGNGFERVYFKNTTFEGFDFGRHRSALLRTGWTIHTTEEAPSLAADAAAGTFEGVRSRIEGAADTARWTVDAVLDQVPSGVHRKSIHETTYLKAKNGANRIGDSKAAAEFFQKEMTFRRKRHAEVALNGWGRNTQTATIVDRIAAAGAWVANVGLAATTGYGEKPHRVLVVSLATILTFAGLFALVPGSEFGSEQSLSELLLLSFQSFITFVIGSPTGTDVPYALRFVSAVEGLIGAFLVALSVFALTRSVHR
ncbi:hypothetical protein [Natronomonas sp.]|uniref:hypothetical protein n=1 Tax=Natronomonas sp. TaxID=2184060 RepID=UPI003976CA6C